jgi:ATP-dependent DNA helicase RecG
VGTVPGDGTTSGTGGPPEESAARALLALVPPLRFALAGDARAGRLAGFGATAQGAVARARASGVPDSPALARLEAEASGFDALPARERRRALARMAAHLSSLIPLPPELRDVARTARIEMLTSGRPAPSTATPTATPTPT